MKLSLISLLIFYSVPVWSNNINVFFFGRDINIQRGYCLIARYQYPHYLEYEIVSIAESKTRHKAVLVVCNNKYGQYE